jgi:hypothetical protein
LRLPNWGPGRIHLIVEGIAGAEGRIALKLGTTTLAETTVQQGQPWQLQGWGDATDRTPAISLESPPYNTPGETRDLGLLVKRMEIYAPDARLRAWLDIALLGLTGILLYAFLLIRTNRRTLSIIAGAAVPALYGPLSAFRDPWMDAVAWSAPIILLAALLAGRLIKLPPGVPSARPPLIPASTFAVVALSTALILIYLGYMNAFDSDRMYDMTAGFAEHGKPTRYPGLETWTKYGFGQSLIAVPFYLVGKLFDLLGGDFEPVTRLTVSFTNLIVTALTVLLLYKAVRLFASVNVSLAVAATYLLATPALNYGRTFFSEPAGGLLLLSAILLILPDKSHYGTGAQPAKPGNPDATDYTLPATNYLLAGLCLGAMLLFKPAFAIYWPPIGIAILWLTLRSKQYSKRNMLTRLSFFAVGPLLALLIQAWYNYVRYSPLPDAILRTGYEKEGGFSTPLLEGLGGLLLSPGKSILLYAPIVILAPIGLWLMLRRPGSTIRLAAVFIISEVGMSLVFNALWWAWTGNFAWGPRLIMPVLPLLVWAAAAILADKPRESTLTPQQEPPPTVSLSRVPSVLWLILAVMGALVNIPGAMVDFQVYYRNYGLLLAGQPGEAITIYDPVNSPLLVEPGYLLDGLTAAIHRPSLASVGMPPIWDTIVPVILAALSVITLWYATSRNRKQS